MVPTLKLFSIAEEENIAIEYQYLMGFYGIYVCASWLANPCIVLNKDLHSNERLLRCVLAHELGHHFKTAGNTLAANHNYYIPAKTESLADNWALDLLVPQDQLVDKLKQKHTIDDLTEFFYVEREFVLKQMERVEMADQIFQ